MANIRVLVVEDNPLHRQKLEFYLEEAGYVLAGSTDNYGEAMRLFRAVQPDLLLLDIHITGERDGIELAMRIREESNAPLIFTTSLKSKDVIDRAKATDPDAYLIKPLNADALRAAIEVAIYKASQGRQLSAPPAESMAWTSDVLLRDCIFVKTGKHLKKVPIKDIVLVRSGEEKYCDVVAENTEWSVRCTLTELGSRLPVPPFFRVHRTTIINTHHITGINEADSKVELGALSVPIGRSYKAEFMARLNLLR